MIINDLLNLTRKQFHGSTYCLMFLFFLLPARMMESMSHEVELRSAEPEIIELLIEFIYTAR